MEKILVAIGVIFLLIIAISKIDNKNMRNSLLFIISIFCCMILLALLVSSI